MYDDPEHPDRPTSSLASPEWTPDDRDLLLALEQYENTLCPGCGQPKDLAWHGWGAESWESEQWVCHGCTAQAGGQEKTFSYAHSSATVEDRASWPPFEVGETTTEPTPPEQH